MKAMNWILGVMILGAGMGAGWWWRGRSGSEANPSPTASARKIRMYQSPMHPWITSPEPGNCTLCGMKLVPVYEGDAGFDSGEGSLRLGSNSISVVGIASVPIDVRRLTRSLRLAGTLDDDDSRHRILSAYVEGRIETLSVHSEGVEIVEGTELATVYSPVLLGAVREYLSLASGGESGSLMTAAALRLRQMGLGEAQVQDLTKSFTNGQRLLPWLSPMSGTVVKRLVYGGQWVREGDPLFEVADFAVMWFKADAYERDLPWLRVGQEVVMTLPSLPGQSFTNRITFIDPNLDMMTRSTRVRVEVPNPKSGPEHARLFRHRGYAEARVRVESEPVLVVPRTAVLNPGGSPVVWVEQAEGHYQQRSIRLGRAGDDAWEVIEGLDAGERVVVQGGVILDGQAQMRGGGGTSAPDPMTGTNGIAGASAASSAGGEAGGPGAVSPVPVTSWRPGSPEIEAKVVGLLKILSRMAAVLAQDDLPGFNRVRPEWSEATQPLTALGQGAPPVDWLKPLAEAKDLASARKGFHGLSLVWSPLVLELRKRETFQNLKVYRCPMTARAFPGAPPRAVWWQWDGPLRNPWFGADMLDCGTEVP